MLVYLGCVSMCELFYKKKKKQWIVERKYIHFVICILPCVSAYYLTALWLLFCLSTCLSTALSPSWPTLLNLFIISYSDHPLLFPTIKIFHKIFTIVAPPPFTKNKFSMPKAKQGMVTCSVSLLQVSFSPLCCFILSFGILWILGMLWKPKLSSIFLYSLIFHNRWHDL